jgi:hypothetical protein
MTVQNRGSNLTEPLPLLAPKSKYDIVYRLESEYMRTYS